jgi:acyl-CoA synthetase (AMP-forming)/AMP-acid ligase II
MRIQYIGDAGSHPDEVGSSWDEIETVALVPVRSPVSRAWLEASLDRLPERLRTGHFCLLSSGSTGAPRLFVGAKARAERLVRVLHDAQDSEPVAETIVALPLSYSYALVNQFVWSRVFGRRLTMTPGFARPEALILALENAADAMLCLVGPQGQMLPGMLRGHVFPGVIRLHFAGGRFPQEYLRALRTLFPNAAIFNNYGCVEAMPRLAIRKADDASSASDVGCPIPGVELSLRSDSSLLFRSPFSAVASLNPDGCRETSRDEWLPTGDLAALDNNGHWQLVGRKSEVFKRYGEKIALPQILSTVNAGWDGQAGAYRDQDSAGEDGYVLVVAPHPRTPEVQGLLRVFRQSFRRSHWPLRIESVPEMPVLPSGKIDHAALRASPETTLHWRQRI